MNAAFPLLPAAARVRGARRRAGLDHRNHLQRCGLLDLGDVDFRSERLENLGGLINFVVFGLVDPVQPLDDFRLLVVDR